MKNCQFKSHPGTMEENRGRKTNGRREETDAQRRGLAIGFIAKYRVPTRWFIHMHGITRVLPGALGYTYAYALGDFSKEPDKTYASMRTEVVNCARALKHRWLLFLDTDVFPPEDAVARLMSHEQPIVSGIYWTKGKMSHPIIYKEFGNGPIWKINRDEYFFPIGGSGLGCCLIDMAVFDAFDSAGLPYFRQDWIHEEGGRKTFVDTGEDYYFFTKAKELGFQAYADANVICPHYDETTDTFFPDQSTESKENGAALSTRSMRTGDSGRKRIGKIKANSGTKRKGNRTKPKRGKAATA